jgi:DNA helicase-2/ATP-dependent DNA helicase PcrA
MSNLLKNLNSQQQKAVQYNKGPMLVLAGAGSGKTRVLTYRIAYLLSEKGINPTNILAVTFTNKAANEMKERIRQLIDTHYQLPITNYPFAGTFHSFCASVLRKDGYQIGISRSFVIYDQSDQIKVVKKVLKKLDISQKKFRASSIHASISQAKNELLLPDNYSSIASGYWQEVVAEVYKHYQAELIEAKALDFDDLLVFTVNLFKVKSQVLEKYQNRFKYILVDEYQDTNTAQYTLTKLLAGKSKNICVVGDCSQSIYGWRGANYRNVLNFQKAFPKAVVFKLERNYRSTQIILDAATAVIKNNLTHPILSLWTNKSEGAQISLYEAYNEKDEADFIVRTLLDLNQKNAKLKASDIAVLYRTNAQSRVIEEAFLHYGIPYVLVGGVRFYERKEIKDILAYLRLVVNSKDSVSLDRARKIGKRRLSSLLDFIKRSKDIKSELTTLEIMDEILQATRYLERFNSENEEDRARLENIRELKSVAAEYPKIIAFLENVALVEMETSLINSKNMLIRNEKKDAIMFMTLHQAKGLEFNTVFIVGVEEGLFPHSRSLEDAYELEEERRLAYVGITRAKERLFLTHAQKRLYFGSWARNPVSRFITEIPEHLLKPVFPNLDL